MCADARSHCGFTQNTRLIMTFKHLKYQMGIMSMRFLLLERQLRQNLERLCVWCKQTATFCCVWCLEAAFLLICSCFECNSTLLSSYSLLLCSLILFLISTVSAFFLLQLWKAKCMCVCVCKPLFHRFPNWDKGSVCAAHQPFGCKSHMNIAVNLDNGIKLVKRL